MKTMKVLFIRARFVLLTVFLTQIP